MLSVGKRGGAALAAGARAADCPVAELRARADFSLRVTGIDCVNLAGGIVWYAGSGEVGQARMSGASLLVRQWPSENAVRASGHE
eukprot:scaffold6138_cov105-Isochrysis_galbana.AAC.4